MVTHDIIIIISKVADMKGNATTGYLAELHDALLAAKFILDNGGHGKEAEINAQVHVIGDWVDEQETCVPEMTADLQALL